MKVLFLFLSLTLVVCPALSEANETSAASSTAPTTAPAAKISEKSGLPLPRFVTTRSASINVRTGPGERYPVEWVFKKKGMPVEVIAEYDTWRKVRDWEGTVGWVHQAMLTGHRAAVVYPDKAVLRSAPELTAAPEAELAPGVITKIENCHDEWCEVALDKLKGFVRRSELWGVYPTETIE